MSSSSHVQPDISFLFYPLFYRQNVNDPPQCAVGMFLTKGQCGSCRAVACSSLLQKSQMQPHPRFGKPVSLELMQRTQIDFTNRQSINVSAISHAQNLSNIGSEDIHLLSCCLYFRHSDTPLPLPPTQKVCYKTHCETGSPSISRMTPFSCNLCALYLSGPLRTWSFLLQWKRQMLSKNISKYAGLKKSTDHSKPAKKKKKRKKQKKEKKQRVPLSSLIDLQLF